LETDPGQEESGLVKAEDRIDYARLVWKAWLAKRQDNGMGFMTPAEWFLITKWMDAEVPLRIVLRGIQDCAGKIGPRTQLTYAASSVEEAVNQWDKAMSR
jgi:hypothetical protein